MQSIQNRHWKVISVLILTGMLLAGCHDPPSRLNAPPQGWSSRQADMQEHFVYMTDNAMLAEMSVSDVHFVPHQDVLNSLGARRLDRYACLLKDMGGTLNYDTTLYEQDMIEKRMENIRRYLDAAGAGEDVIKVACGAVRTEGMTAQEAMLARDNVAVKSSCKQDGAAASDDQSSLKGALGSK